MAAFGGHFQRLALALTVAVFTQTALGALKCEDLPKDFCAFSISSQGTRCVLEMYTVRVQTEYECKSSDVMVENNMVEWIETDECIESCGLERDSVGISSDALLESHFTQKLCSPQCQRGCPNIVDLYLNLAAAEGVYLPMLCEAERSNSRRGMAEIKSAGFDCVAETPVGSPIPIDPPFGLVPDPNAGEPPIYAEPPYVYAPDPYSCPGEAPTPTLVFEPPLDLVPAPSPIFV